nr:hypothetical protein [Zavarzinella formosa]
MRRNENAINGGRRCNGHLKYLSDGFGYSKGRLCAIAVNNFANLVCGVRDYWRGKISVLFAFPKSCPVFPNSFALRNWATDEMKIPTPMPIQQMQQGGFAGSIGSGQDGELGVEVDVYVLELPPVSDVQFCEHDNQAFG